ncbi:MAG TPA: TonB-dependent receptor plug domain-containing protein [Polyangiaceae bacterium]
MALMFAIATFGSIAGAQEPPARASDNASSVTLVPPTLTSSADVPYPSGATGDSVVVLTLTINADGTVRSAHALQVDEPFSTSAEHAALQWRFDPAMRRNQPVASVIHFEVRFVAPKPEPEPPPEPEPGQNAAPPSATQPATLINKAPDVPVEINVRGARLAPAVSSFTRAEVRQLPGAFGDPFRAIEALPGVTPIVSGLPFFYIRGAPPGNVGYFLDGVRVPYLYHVGLGPSIVHPGMVERVDLYPGGYPAQFGRFAGGIVSGEVTQPRTDTHGEANVRLIDAGAMAETGFANGKGTVLLGGRYSYTAALVSLISPTTNLAYHDYQARVSYDITPRDRVSVFSFGSYDLVGQTKNNILTVLFGSEFYRADARYEHRFGESSTLRTDVTLGYDQTRVGDQRNSQDRMISVRSEFHHELSSQLLLRSGADATIDGYTADSRTYSDPEDPETIRFNNLFPPRTDLAVGAWSDVVWNPTPEVEVTPGLRLDLYGSGGANALSLDPRISARFKSSKKVRIIHAYGLAHQPPSFVVPIPGLTPGKLQGGLQSTFQTSAGVEADLPSDITATATLFHNAFFNMTDALSLVPAGVDNPLDQRSRGQAFGFELFVRRRLTKKLGGYLSYTLSRSTRSIDGYTFPSSFDRTHVASAALAYDLGRRWRAGSRLVFYTGVPKSPPADNVIVVPQSHPDRQPTFYRVDVRLEKRWQLTQKAWISFVLEVMNVTLSKETVGNSTIGPVTIPSVGVEAGF